MNSTAPLVSPAHCPASHLDSQMNDIRRLLRMMLISLEQAVSRLDETATLLDRMVGGGEPWTAPTEQISWQELEAMVGRR